MKLVSYTDVRKAMGFDAGVQQDAIESAIESATEIIAVDLRTPGFDRVDYTDTFYVTRSDCLEHAYGTFVTRLALSAGFVVGDLISATYSAAGGAASIISSDTVSFTPALNAEKGELVASDDLRDCFVYVEYTAGFQPDDADTTLYKPSQVPVWLKRMALLQSLVLIDSTNPTLRHEKGSDATNAMKQNKDAYNSILGGRMRYFPRAIHPR